jgi:hypothetical protein
LAGVIGVKSLSFFPRLFRRAKRRNNSPAQRNHFLLSRRRPETADGYQADNETAGNAGSKTGDSQMRTLSFILAFAFVLAPSVAGLSDSLPGIGTFAYNGSPIAASAPQALKVAAN